LSAKVQCIWYYLHGTPLSACLHYRGRQVEGEAEEGGGRKRRDDSVRDIQTSKKSNEASLLAPLLYCADASASEKLGVDIGLWGADRWLSVSYPEIARKRLSGWSDMGGDVTRRGPIAGFRAWP
jgi:hypothetical protein